MRFFVSLLGGLLAFAFVMVMALFCAMAGGTRWASDAAGFIALMACLIGCFAAVGAFSFLWSTYVPRPPVHGSWRSINEARAIDRDPVPPNAR